jgi:hypothetical protein
MGPDDTYSELLKANVNLAARKFDFTWESFVANAPEGFPKIFTKWQQAGLTVCTHLPARYLSRAKVS